MADKPLTIKDWQLGIGESPYTGFGQMVNVDIFSKPGSLKISHSLVREAESIPVVDELIKWTVQDPRTAITYSVDRNGKLYRRTTGGNWTVITGHGVTAANGEGIGIWKDYLFYARRTRIDVYGPLSAGPTWTNDWEAITPGTPYDLESSFGYDLHPMMAAQDDHFYIGNGHFVDNIIEVAGQTFDPTNPATWTYNDPQLLLASYYRVACLEDFGTYVAAGTLVGNNGTMNIADTFFWDGASDSFVRGATIHFAENGVQMMKNTNNVLYTIAGLGTPRVFQSATSQAQELKRFNNIDVPIQNKLKLFPGATDVKDGEVLFGIGRFGGNNDISPMGVYSYRNGAYVLRHLISTGRDGSTDSLAIGSVKTISAERILVSWADSDEPDVYGVDLLSNFFYTEYTAYVESPYYTVGTEADPKTYEKVEIRMGKKFDTGDGVRVKIRRNLTDTFTTVATFDFTTFGARDTMELRVANIGSLTGAQFRIELTTEDDSQESPELKEVVFT